MTFCPLLVPDSGVTLSLGALLALSGATVNHLYNVSPVIN